MKPQDSSEPETPGHDSLALILSSKESCAGMVSMTLHTFTRMPVEWQCRVIDLIKQVEVRHMQDSIESTMNGLAFQPKKWQMYGMPDEWKAEMAEAINEYLNQQNA